MDSTGQSVLSEVCFSKGLLHANPQRAMDSEGKCTGNVILFLILSLITDI